jgi:hypothetical protein
MTGALVGRHAPRVLLHDELARIARHLRPGIARLTLFRQIDALLKNGALHRVARGVYLNLLADPVPQVAEAVPKLRKDAVVSLHTVLGEAGVLNNPTAVVYAVLPMQESGHPVKVGEFDYSGSAFRFFAMPMRVLIAGREQDRLDASSRYPRATPEKAFVDHIYLGASPRSRLGLPPTDVDLTEMDSRKLRRLAVAAGVESALDEWMRSYRHEQPSVRQHYSRGPR